MALKIQPGLSFVGISLSLLLLLSIIIVTSEGVQEDAPIMISTYSVFQQTSNVLLGTKYNGHYLFVLDYFKGNLWKMDVQVPETTKVKIELNVTSPRDLLENKYENTSTSSAFLILSLGLISRFETVTETLVPVIGSGQVGCVDGLGQHARVNDLFQIAPFPKGDAFLVSDKSSHTLRHVQLPEFNVTTVVGQCDTQGGADGVGKQALLNNPAAIMFHSASEVFLGSGLASCTIRLITLPQYDVTTVVGTYGVADYKDGIGTFAKIKCANSFWPLDDASFLFNDCHNVVIRKVSLPNFIVSTVLGTVGSGGYKDGFGTSAKIEEARSFSLLSEDLLFLTEGNRMRVVTLPTARVNITTLVEFPNSASYAAFGMAMCGSSILSIGGSSIIELPVADRSEMVIINSGLTSANAIMTHKDMKNCSFLIADDTHRIVLFDYLTRTLTPVAGNIKGCSDGLGEGARLNGPLVLAAHPVESYGILTDYFSHTLRKIDLLNFTVTTVVGKCYQADYADGYGRDALAPFPIGIGFRSPTSFYFGGKNVGSTIRSVSLPDFKVVTVIGYSGDPRLQDGVGLTAKVGSVQSILFVSDLLFFFVDTANRCVRKVELPLHVVVTVAGMELTGNRDGFASLLSAPVSLFSDGKKVYVVDNRWPTLNQLRAKIKVFDWLSTSSVFPATQTSALTPSPSIAVTPSASTSGSLSKVDAVTLTRSSKSLTVKDDTKTHSKSISKSNRSSTISLAVPFVRKPDELPPSTRVLATVFNDDETSALAVQGTGSAGSAITGISGSTSSISSAFRMNSLLGSVLCSFYDIAEAPSWMEAVVFPVGSGPLRYFAGATLATSIVVTMLNTALLLLRWMPGKVRFCRIVAKVLGVMAAMSQQVYIPSICGMSTLLLVHGGGEGENEALNRGIGAICLSIAIGWMLWLGYKLTLGFHATAVTKEKPGDDRLGEIKRSMMRTEFLNESSDSLFVESFQLTFDATSDCSKLRCRLYFLEELVASVLMAIIGGIRPTEGSCYAIASAMLVVALCHFFYLCVARPYRTRLDLGFALLFGVNLMLIGVLSIVSITTDILYALLAAAVMVQEVSMILQTIAQCFWLYVLFERRRFRSQAEKDAQQLSSQGGSAAAAVPMLNVPVNASSNSNVTTVIVNSNPLLNA